MKLSQEQIAKIDEKLTLKGLVYEDIKLELLDHIASDTENVMTDKEIAFEIAFKDVFRKWKPQLQPFKSWFLEYDKIPIIVTNKMINQVKYWFIVFPIVIATIITFFVSKSINMFENKAFMNSINSIFKTSFIVIFFLSILTMILIKIAKNNTTYKSFSKQTSRFSICFTGTFLYLSGSKPFLYFDANLYLNLIMISLLTFVTIVSIVSFIYLYKHFEFERKLSKV
ncbi:hypothetical protein [Flavobacterium myungsuense]|uniref:DUF1129 family protein n=1 Tax=Flavobacterium myungsuense TaxID=651823 RepID=A0ABW3J4M4_9FLAO